MKCFGMRQASALAVSLIFGVFGAWYVLMILEDKTHPVFAMWLFFSLATILGMVTYVMDRKSKGGLVTNIANTVDVVMTTSILVVLFVHSKDILATFGRVEVICLIGVAITFLYWLTRRDSKTTNLAVNAIITIGYIPLFFRMWYAHVNTEPLGPWGMILVAQVIALYNPTKERDFLARVYAYRAVVLVLILLALMIRVEMR